MAEKQYPPQSWFDQQFHDLNQYRKKLDALDRKLDKIEEAIRQHRKGETK